MSETILHHLIKRFENHKEQTALRFKDQNKWATYRWRDFFQLTQDIGASLKALEVSPGDRVGIVSQTRPEWIVSDLGILSIGAVTVPIYPSYLPADMEYIINDSQIRVLLLENDSQLEKWLQIRSQCPSVEHTILFKNVTHPKALGWSDFLSQGRQYLSANPKTIIEQMKMATLEQVATIPYTSGTAGQPKGVVLTHRQIMSELVDVFQVIPVDMNDTTLTFLPYSHILGRVEAWGSIYAGYTLAFAENIDRIKSNLAEIHPTFMVSVPRIFEKIYAGILNELENSGIRKSIFKQAQAVGLEVSRKLQNKQAIGPLLGAKYELSRQLVFKKVLQALGGRMRFAISGGAPLGPEISQFFHGLGLLICEGYGLTETTAGITFNSPLDYKFGSVGRALPDVELRVAKDGEILVRSDKVMTEYYKNPDATRAALSEGFFHTGDIGHVDKDGFLFITDRKKDLIKTAGGKYVAPQKLENLLKLSPYISNVLIHGDQKKYIIALITLQPKYQSQYKDQKMIAQIKDAVANANEQLANYESIKKFTVLPNDFTIEGGELTPSMKVKRRVCDEKFKAQIEDLY